MTEQAQEPAAAPAPGPEENAEFATATEGFRAALASLYLAAWNAGYKRGHQAGKGVGHAQGYQKAITEAGSMLQGEEPVRVPLA